MSWAPKNLISRHDRLTAEHRHRAGGGSAATSPKHVVRATTLAVVALALSACTSDGAADNANGSSPDGTTESNGEAEASIAAVTPAEGTPNPDVEGSSGDEITLRVAMWDENQAPTQQQYIDAFEAEHPEVTIELEVLAFRDYVQALQTAQTGGGGYDIVWMNAPNLPTFVGNDILLPLSDYVAADGFDTSVFPPGLVDMYTVDEQLYAIPKDFDTIGLFYNKAAFAAAGVAEPTDDWTWDDLREAAAALTTDTQKGFAAVPYEQELIFPLIFSAGGDPLTADGTATDLESPAACSALEFAASFHVDGTSPDIATLDTTWYVEDFVAGKIAMVTTGSWDTKIIVDQMGDDAGLVDFPAGTRDANLIHGLGWAIMSSSQHPDTAWEFIKSISSQSAQEVQARDAVAIPSYEGTAKIWTDSFDTLDATVFTRAATTADPFPVAASDGGWTAEMYTVLSEQLSNDPGSADLCAAVNAAANAYIADHPVG